MTIKTEFLGLYQVRFETLFYGDPVFNKTSDDPLRIEFRGGTIGIHQTYYNTDISLPISVECQIEGPHYVYDATKWNRVSSGSYYQLNLYEYIWFSTMASNVFNLTECDYA